MRRFPSAATFSTPARSSSRACPKRCSWSTRTTCCATRVRPMAASSLQLAFRLGRFATMARSTTSCCTTRSRTRPRCVAPSIRCQIICAGSSRALRCVTRCSASVVRHRSGSGCVFGLLEIQMCWRHQGQNSLDAASVAPGSARRAGGAATGQSPSDDAHADRSAQSPPPAAGTGCSALTVQLNKLA
jgi:hypothetical protein